VSTFMVIAKAGGSSEAAENTCEAISRAAALRAPDGVRVAIEVDLRLSSDERHVALHDARLERTTDGRGLVRSLSASQLRRLNAGPGAQKVPALAEVLEASRECPLLLDLHDDDPAGAAALCDELARAPRWRRDLIWVASEHTRVITAVRRLDPTLRTAATKREAWGKLLFGSLGLPRLVAHGHVWIVPERHLGLPVVTPRFVHDARAAGDSVWVFVVDDAPSATRLRSGGVGGCVTTRPEKLTAELSQTS